MSTPWVEITGNHKGKMVSSIIYCEPASNIVPTKTIKRLTEQTCDVGPPLVRTVNCRLQRAPQLEQRYPPWQSTELE